MDILLIGVICYLIGSIPFGFILTKIFLKKDIRDIGSGNIGATNALRTGNKLIGYSTLFFDIIKAVIPVIYIKINFPELLFIASLCAFIGHVFPIWLMFKGGKGVACFFGGFLIISPIPTLISMAVWMVTVKITKISSLGALLSIFLLTSYQIVSNYGTLNKATIFAIMLLIFWKHSENIKRLIQGKENKINL